MEGIQSIRLSDLETILELLCQEMEHAGRPKPPGGYTSEDLKQYLLQTGTHIPQRFLHLFSVDAADDIITYMWLGTPLLCIPHLLRRRARGVNIRVWVDVVFNDQRTPQSITRAVAAANTFYMRAASHTLIYSEAEYPAFDERGTQVAPRMCQPWERCWCLVELAVRDLAVRQQGKQASVMEMQDEFRQVLADRLGSPATAEANVRAMFHGRDFFRGMQGRPDDVRGIQMMLLSSGFFPTSESFNKHMSEKLTTFFLSNLEIIMGGAVVSPPAQLLAAPAMHPAAALIAPAAASLDPIAAAFESAHAAELEQVRAEAAMERVKAEAASAAELERVKAEAAMQRVKAEAAASAAELERFKTEAAMERVKAEAAMERVKVEAAASAAELERVRAEAALAELERVRAEAATASATPHCRCCVS